MDIEDGGCLRVTIPVINPELIPAHVTCGEGREGDVCGFRGLGPITENKGPEKQEQFSLHVF